MFVSTFRARTQLLSLTRVSAKLEPECDSSLCSSLQEQSHLTYHCLSWDFHFAQFKRVSLVSHREI